MREELSDHRGGKALPYRPPLIRIYILEFERFTVLSKSPRIAVMSRMDAPQTSRGIVGVWVEQIHDRRGERIGIRVDCGCTNPSDP